MTRLLAKVGDFFLKRGAIRRNLDIFAGTAFFWLKSRFIVKESYPNDEIETIMRKQPPQTNNQMISLEAGCSKLNWRLHFFLHHANVDFSPEIADRHNIRFRIFIQLLFLLIAFFTYNTVISARMSRSFSTNHPEASAVNTRY